jgi:hypothetical protein
MNRTEFAQIMVYLAAGTGKQVAAETVEVYYDLLCDLPSEALAFAVKRSLLESAYPVVPPVGTLRRLALDAMNAAHREPTADEAWELVRRALNRFGYMREEEGLAGLPAGPVRRAAECLGWRSLCDSTEPEISRAQYRKAFETLQGRQQRERLLPAPMIAALEHIGTLPKLPELQGYDHRNAWQVIADAARQRGPRRRLLADSTSQGRLEPRAVERNGTH